jgi:MerR family Zn(II)-responsive transcriptional regulator of zntA
MLINELSKISGLSAHTIRYYEKYGLIKGIRKEDVKSNNYFHYSDDDAYKLNLIKEAKSIGFTLNEIKELLDAWFNKAFSIADKIAILDQKKMQIDQKIKQLKEVKHLIEHLKSEVLEKDC